MQAITFKKNQELEGTVLDLSSQGEGVVKVDGFAFFVAGALPQEIIRFKVIKVGKRFGYGRLLEIMQPSQNRVEIRDNLGSQIGTMTLQHLSYPGQLAFKQKLVQEDFARIGHFTDVTVKETLAAPSPWGYRNKAQVPLRQVKGQLETGFFRRLSHDLVPIENFHIQDPFIDQIILIVRDILRDFNLSAYDEKSGRGLLRHLVVKRGHYSGQVMIILVVNGDKLPKQEQVVEKIVAQVPGLVSLILNINRSKGNAILGRQEKVLWGQATYHDQMLGLDFEISAQSFYQVNTPQAEELYRLALAAADLQGHERVLDAYCGIGTISLALAQQAKEVYAMEIVPQAIEMAKLNAQVNALTNVHFEAGKAEVILPKWQEQGLDFDVAVVDPPRKGLDRTFVDTLIDLNPGKIVYVSCNPATCARDCAIFAEAGYEVKTIKPVDIFPQTVHVECVVLIEKNEL
ncbi:23S rRNA (uracil(1939)-C(5))-methyltransferase RlmD [Eremococcus coleocola]|uniref:23S rRNA (uracil(1939)-C(5))-methyltransferase RlmD n=1 Tax=Eremococcus coleocola TaxID=88132 RepID=UPI0003F59348|nr:23S rRNA (uracil(1939)-C(5))-methyltransferase RlmD [Eremococcus coleocola]